MKKIFNAIFTFILFAFSIFNHSQLVFFAIKCKQHPIFPSLINDYIISWAGEIFVLTQAPQMLTKRTNFDSFPHWSIICKVFFDRILVWKKDWKLPTYTLLSTAPPFYKFLLLSINFVLTQFCKISLKFKYRVRFSHSFFSPNGNPECAFGSSLESLHFFSLTLFF